MNKVCLIGNMTKDPELRMTANGKTVCSFTIAVARSFDRDHSDFINCQAWGKTAEIIDQYCSKGSKIGVEGRIDVSTYEKNGETVWMTKVIADHIDLIGNRSNNTQTQYASQDANSSGAQQPISTEQRPQYAGSLTEMAEGKDPFYDFGTDDLPF